MIFFDPYENQPNKECTPAGKETLPQYIEDVDKNGKKILKRTTDVNIYEKIQEESDGSDVYSILEHYIKTGDISTLNKNKAIYGDFLNMPKTTIEAFNMATRAERAFNESDKSIRELFENDVNVFKKSIADGTLNEKLAKFMPKEKEIVTQQPAPAQEIKGVNLNE